MIDLYTFGTPNGLRASVFLEECGFAYRTHKVDLATGDNRRPEFLKLNPLGMIPVVVDTDGPGGQPLTLTQSGAIARHYAEKAGRFIPRDPGRRVLAEQWFMAAMTDFACNSGAWVMLSNRVPEKVPSSIDWFEKRLVSFFADADRRLGEAEYLAGEITLADLALYPIAAARKAMIDKVGSLAHLGRWMARVAVRPGVARGMKAPA